MTKQQVQTVLGMLKTAYPSFGGDNNPADVAALWFDMFADDDAAAVYAAVKVFIATDTKGFPPHIGAIKERLYASQLPQALTEMDAWNLVMKAVRNGLYGYAEEWVKLPPVVQKTLGSQNVLREWAMIAPSELQTVTFSHFRRMYQDRVRDGAVSAMLPEGTGGGSEALPERCLP